MKTVGSCVGSVTGAAVSRQDGGLGTGGGSSATEYVDNPQFAGSGAPWDAFGSSIGVGSGSAQWFEDGFIQAPLAVQIPAAAGLTLRIDAVNAAGNTIRVRLLNSGAGTNQIIYVGTATGAIVQAFTADVMRDQIRVEGSGGGSASFTLTRVSIT